VGDNDSETMSMVERLSVLAADVVGDLDEVTRSTDGDTTEYGRGGAAFARATSTGLEIRLPADIAAAADRTPDTATFDGDWLRFTPATDGQHALDRAEAWLLTAWRHMA
jgi:hypothetical protein